MLPSRLSILLLLAMACDDSPPGDLGECDDRTDITWADAKPILDLHCAGCHSAELTGDDRQGAPVLVDLDTPEAARNHSHAAWAAIFSGRMPPTQQGLSVDEQRALWTWWTCDGPE